MLRKLLFMAMVCLFTSAAAVAQTGTLTGIVTDAVTGETLPGVNIFLAEIERGTATDIDGNFKITELPNRIYNVRATFVGYKRFETTVEVNGETTLNIQLKEDLIGLDEIIVTGQGGASVEKKRLSTTVEVITAKQLESIPSSRLDQVLQANLPNSQIRLTSGMPGTASLIKGRGVNSALTSTTPVIYIDGVRVDQTSGFAQGIATGGAQSSAIADIPIENIERIEVLKGGSATTLYGADAANGVIQIFTKKGVRGATRFTFETNLGATKGTEDFLHYDRTADALYRTGFYQDYRLSASGGNENLTYSFSGSMMDDGGFRPNSEQVRHNLRTSVTAQITDWVRYTGSVGFTSSEFDRDNNANSSFATFGNLEAGVFGNLPELSGEEFNGVIEEVDEIQGLVDITEDVKRFQTSHQLDFNITKGLTAKALVGLEQQSRQQQDAQTNQYLIALGAVAPGTTTEGSLERFERDFLGVTLEGNVQYRTDFGDFSSITVVGGQLFRTDDRQVNLLGNVMPDGVTSLNSASSVDTEDFRQTVANWGGYVQENFGYKNRYFIELGGRVDGNTAFGTEIGSEFFPKIGASYSISSEPFFQDNIPSSIISNMKFRASWGQAGNFPTPFANTQIADIDPFLNAQAIELGNPADPKLSVERSTTFEVGADLGFANDRISVELTYFNQTTEDALFDIDFARSTGFVSALRNVGEIENSGFEIATNLVIVQQRDFGLRFNGSVNTLDNEVISTGGAPFSIGGFSFLGSWVQEGEAVGFLRGNRPTFDANGNIAEVEPNASLGSPIADVFGILGLNLNWKGLSFNASADYQLGAQGVNVDEVLRFFRGLGDDRTQNGTNFFDLAGVWVEDTDYLKIRLMGVSYTIPERFYSAALRRVDVGFSVTNPINIFSSNFDPEITGASIGTQSGGSSTGVGGFGFGTESPPRQFLGRLRVSF